MLKIHILDWEIDDNDMGRITHLTSFPFYGHWLFLTNINHVPDHLGKIDLVHFNYLTDGGFQTGFILHPFGDTKNHIIGVVRQDSWLKTMAVLFHEMIHFMAWHTPEIIGEWINDAIDWVPKRLR